MKEHLSVWWGRRKSACMERQGWRCRRGIWNIWFTFNYL